MTENDVPGTVTGMARVGEVKRKPLRRRDPSFTVAPPTGTTIKTRLHVTDAEAVVLADVGMFLGSLHRSDLRARINHSAAGLDGDGRTERKQVLTDVSSARWAGTITRAVNDQYDLSMRGLQAHVDQVTAAVGVLGKRLAVPPGACDVASHTAGYKDAAERFGKSRRLGVLQDQLKEKQHQLAVLRPAIVIGGKDVLKKRAGLGRDRTAIAAWAKRWGATRMFLAADGETGKLYGNETIRLTPDGVLTIKIPNALAATHGTHLTIAAPVQFRYRAELLADRIAAHQTVAYDIRYDAGSKRWYLSASWTIPAPAHIPTPAQIDGRVLGIDLNDEHVDGWVVDVYGNPVGAPIHVPFAVKGLPATTRDAAIRHVVTRLIHLARQHGCVAIAVENLNFADARATGRETMGRGKRGKRFRATVAGIPTGQFRDRMAAMCYTAGLWVIAVDPAYTSKWSKQHWLKPMTAQQVSRKETKQSSQPPVTGHSVAGLAVGRRGYGYGLKRRKVSRTVTRAKTVRQTPSRQTTRTGHGRTIPAPGTPHHRTPDVNVSGVVNGDGSRPRQLSG